MTAGSYVVVLYCVLSCKVSIFLKKKAKLAFASNSNNDFIIHRVSIEGKSAAGMHLNS
jgi:hypothetical protein